MRVKCKKQERHKNNSFDVIFITQVKKQIIKRNIESDLIQYSNLELCRACNPKKQRCIKFSQNISKDIIVMSQAFDYFKQAFSVIKQTETSSTKTLVRKNHELYMKEKLNNIGKEIIFFDVAQGWIYYYTLNSLTNLGVQISEDLLKNITKALKYCWNQKYGGFGGGYLQLPHLVQTYSCFLSVLLIGPTAYHLLNKEGLTKFLKSCKKQGKFQVTMGAQTDLRATFIATIIVKLLNLDLDLLKGVPQAIIASQTYEGGLSHTKGAESHGGYTFCGVATLSLMGRLHELDIPRLTLWLSRRQCKNGGFCGRTNKLFDSCYSFWVGAIFHILNNYFQKKICYNTHLIYSECDLQNYITFFCQNVNGGFRDKPGKEIDLYHTAYSLSGLALSQQIQCVRLQDKLQEIDPIYNINKSKLQDAMKFFRQN